ncbi:hypothetical protein OG339_48195 (plasmid) [Streptosporangium sp. NBC_01495]|uniref:hypothetical protein n=1 Tax=Streptosporangium sp. NBC_01495 TaxID=2903899 RepID=UPI002E38169E|nr:hypothetical protein [Streptosporangium sp. NBC_01495]
MEQIHAGLALEVSRADYRLARLEGWQPTTPSRFTAVEFTLARVLAGQPRWFVVSRTDTSQATSRSHLIFMESSATGGLAGWRVVTGSTAADGQDLPRFARSPDGYADTVSRDTHTLVAPPDRVARAHAQWVADLRDTSDASDARKVLTANGYTAEAVRKRRIERDTRLQGQWDVQIQARPTKAVYGLRTVNGGALVWYGFRETHTYLPVVEGAGRISFTSQDGRHLLSGGRWYSRVVKVRFATGFLAVVPAAGAGRRATVVGDWHSTLEVSGQ